MTFNDISELMKLFIQQILLDYVTIVLSGTMLDGLKEGKNHYLRC